jgi:hypothetical protein
VNTSHDEAESDHCLGDVQERFVLTLPRDFLWGSEQKPIPDPYPQHLGDKIVQIKNAREIFISRAFSTWWGKKDSNLRSHTAADLQSAPFATRDTPPLNVVGPSRTRNRAAERPWMTVKSEPDNGRPVGAFMGEAAG